LFVCRNREHGRFDNQNGAVLFIYRVSVIDPSSGGDTVKILRSYSSIKEAAEAENVDVGNLSQIVGNTSKATFTRNRETKERVFFARTEDVEDGTFVFTERNSQKLIHCAKQCM